MWWVIYTVRDNEWITKWPVLLVLQKITQVSRKNVGLGFVVGATMNILSFWRNWALTQLTVRQPLNTQHPISHCTHTYAHISSLFGTLSWGSFLCLLPPVNLTFSADFMETLSDAAELYTCFSSILSDCFVPAVKTWEVNIQHVCSLEWCCCSVIYHLDLRRSSNASLCGWTAVGTQWHTAQMEPNPIYTSA